MQKEEDESSKDAQQPEAGDEDEVDKLIEEMMESIASSSESQQLTMRDLE